ncbi:sensor histidine kinase [Mucilaginibacter sabulilitoris]|uniref:histidine kinase n=1 Tax=Mucilaginibacter sabulilitoris TaxID=1173583 RepID=A0ABZ0TF85_9SPHI|nr:sensor histidine kinase [Mucilaginibacter sabulilitoris]WPU90933.1 sensor histidine kinase [Mucilaginibacter sabulilitoris]
MIKRLFIYVILLLSASATIAQQSDTLLLKLSKAGKDTNRVNLLLQLGHYYLDKPEVSKKGLDSSLYYIQSAETLSIAISAIDHRYRAIIAKGEFSTVKKDFVAADKLFTEVANYYHKRGDQLKEAQVWQTYADYMPYADLSHLSIRRNGYNKAYEIYKSMHNELKAANALVGMADVDLNLGLYDKTENELLSVIAQYKVLRYSKIYYGYHLLAETYNRRNLVQKTLIARMDCVNSYENDPQHTVSEGILYYYDLGAAYRHSKFFDKALVYFQKTIDMAVKIGRKDFYYNSLMGIMDSYTDLKKYKAALVELRKLSERYKSKSPREESIVLSAQMRFYNLLHDFSSGEKLAPASKIVNNKVYQDLAKDFNYYAVNDFIKISDPLLQHYILSKHWGGLAEELSKLETLLTTRMSVDSKLVLYNDLFKLDSANGNTLSALKKFQRIKAIEDSITTATNTKQINELAEKYESEKKDKTIQNLNNQSTIQKSNLEKSNLQRNITFGGILIAILLAALMYVGYRNKQRSNRQLQIKQDQINRQNNELSALVKEEEKLLKDKDILLKQQEGLLTEKEWLLKEVHHRVKNNLQIVMSLLYSQAAYLQSTDAIDAIRDSRNRVQAISIIHQKLYSKSNVATIVMSEYVAEIVRHLSDSYDCARRGIRFRELIEPVNLDSSQAVPMGLILNEAITNSIKYAFGDDGGEIVIEGHLTNGETICLKIADNGKGLPVDFNLSTTSSLGMEMMRALSKQIGGDFEIQNDCGVVISVKFKVDHSLKSVVGKLVTT